MVNFYVSPFITTAQGVKLKFQALVNAPGVDKFRLGAKAIADGDLVNIRVAGNNTFLDSFPLENLESEFQFEAELRIDQKYCAGLRHKPYSLLLEIESALRKANPSDLNEQGFTCLNGEQWGLVANDIKPCPPDLTTEIEQTAYKAIQDAVREAAFYLLRRLADSNSLTHIPLIFKQLHVICWAVNGQEFFAAAKKQIQEDLDKLAQRDPEKLRQEEIEDHKEFLLNNLVALYFTGPALEENDRLVRLNFYRRRLSYSGHLLFWPSV